MAELIKLLKQTFKQWIEDKIPLLSASLTFYVVLALAPTLIIVVRTASAFLGENSAEVHIVSQMRAVVGAEGAEAIRTILQSASEQALSGVGGAITLLILLIATTTVFVQLQSILNTIWNVERKPTSKKVAAVRLLKRRLLAFLILIGIAILLIALLFLNVGFSSLNLFIEDLLPRDYLLWQVVSFTVSFGILTAIVAVIYKMLPDVNIAWRDVGVGALVTAFLIAIGDFFAIRILSGNQLVSTYGAMGSFIALLLWIYYSAMAFFLGAEFTQVYANHYGHNIEPNESARLVSDQRQAQQT